MNNRQMAQVDKDFVKTLRRMYPFYRSLYSITKELNKKLEAELFAFKKR